jgi:hypothetical protein
MERKTMMKVSIEMPKVAECDVSDCAYNIQNACHARAITVGDGANAMCDTFFKSSSHTKGNFSAGVGACKVSACSFNSDFECQADDIAVSVEGGQAMCMTCSPK